MKEMRTTSETSGAILNAPTFESQESQETKRKAMRKYLRRQQLKNSLKRERKQPPKFKKPREPQSRINPRQNAPKHILIKLMKIKQKEKILKVAREKQQITHKGIPTRVTADLSIESLQARREWQDILKLVKEKNLQPRYNPASIWV